MHKLLLGFFMTAALHASYILPHEGDKQIGAIEDSVATFLNKGGTLIRLEKNEVLTLLPTDIVFPSCSGANNRSQTLWVLLKKFKGITLMPPHATRFGFDPIYGKPNWKGTVHTHPGDEFILFAGYPKSEKFGWNQFIDWLDKDSATEDELNQMKAYYDAAYYGYVEPKGSRRVYITFAKNAHIHLKRLCQVNERLDNVIVAFYPLDDLINEPLKEWNTLPRRHKAYDELSKLLEPHLDYNLVK